MTTLSNPVRVAQWTVRVSLVLAGVFTVLGIRAAIDPSLPSGRGLSGLLLSLLAVFVGPYADAVMWAAMAALLPYFARLTWRHAPRRPGDRWWR